METQSIGLIYFTCPEMINSGSLYSPRKLSQKRPRNSAHINDCAPGPQIKRAHAVTRCHEKAPFSKPQQSFILKTAGWEIAAQRQSPEGKLGWLPGRQHAAELARPIAAPANTGPAVPRQADRQDRAMGSRGASKSSGWIKSKRHAL